MCIILDVNCFNEFQDLKNQDMEPVRKWLKKENNKIVYSPTKKFQSDWKGENKRRWLKQRIRAGKLRQEDKRKVELKAEKLKGNINSNDEHIIALAMVAGVSVLVSHDRDLHIDFSNPQLVGGKVYQKQNHHRLLKPDMCP